MVRIQSVGSYELLEILGHGGMGDVYRGRRIGSDEIVAVKVLRGEYANQTEVIARFLQERDVLVSLDHPSLVRIHNLVIDDGIAAIVMDFCGGGDLRTYLANRGHLDAGDAVSKAITIYCALSIVHAAKVLHRDVKPENVLLDRDGAAHLADFGIAKILERPGITSAYGVLGTPAYMAPEIGELDEISPACDVYSAGILLYELLTGQPPFAAKSPLAMMRLHSDADPVFPTDLNPELWDVVKKCIAKRPEDRPTAQLAADLLTSVQSAVRIEIDAGTARPLPRDVIRTLPHDLNQTVRRSNLAKSQQILPFPSQETIVHDLMPGTVSDDLQGALSPEANATIAGISVAGHSFQLENAAHADNQIGAPDIEEPGDAGPTNANTAITSKPRLQSGVVSEVSASLDSEFLNLRSEQERRTVGVVVFILILIIAGIISIALATSSPGNPSTPNGGVGLTSEGSGSQSSTPPSFSKAHLERDRVLLTRAFQALFLTQDTATRAYDSSHGSKSGNADAEARAYIAANQVFYKELAAIEFPTFYLKAVGAVEENTKEYILLESAYVRATTESTINVDIRKISLNVSRGNLLFEALGTKLGLTYY